MKKVLSWILAVVVVLSLSTGIAAEEADTEDSLLAGDVFDQYWIVRSKYEEADSSGAEISEALEGDRPESLAEITRVIQLLEDEEGELVALCVFTVTPDGIGEKERIDLREEDDAASDTVDQDIVFETDDFTITITDYEILAPGEGANRFGSDYAIRFVYDVYIPEDGKSTSSAMAWTMSVEAIQDNKPHKVNKLNTAILYDASGADAIQDIEAGETLTSSTGYILTDLETPVTIEFKTNRLNPEPDMTVEFPVK